MSPAKKVANQSKHSKHSVKLKLVKPKETKPEKAKPLIDKLQSAELKKKKIKSIWKQAF